MLTALPPAIVRSIEVEPPGAPEAKARSFDAQPTRRSEIRDYWRKMVMLEDTPEWTVVEDLENISRDIGAISPNLGGGEHGGVAAGYTGFPTSNTRVCN